MKVYPNPNTITKSLMQIASDESFCKLVAQKCHYLPDEFQEQIYALRWLAKNNKIDAPHEIDVDVDDLSW